MMREDFLEALAIVVAVVCLAQFVIGVILLGKQAATHTDLARIELKLDKIQQDCADAGDRVSRLAAAKEVEDLLGAISEDKRNAKEEHGR